MKFNFTDALNFTLDVLARRMRSGNGELVAKIRSIFDRSLHNLSISTRLDMFQLELLL